MKNLNTVILAAVMGIAVGSATSAKADEPFLSPRARANQTHYTQVTSANDVNLITNRPAGNARAWALAQSAKASDTQVAQGTSDNDVNLITNRPAGNARAWAQAQSLRKGPGAGPTVQIAPLK